VSWSADTTPLVCIVIEGAVDAFCGRPRDRNPYCPEYARDYWLAWDFGWQDATELLKARGREEAARWLGEAA
jgi:ribosome modulation factor